MKTSVIMPVYNEINTIGEIIRRVEQVDISKEIIIIDDFSTDATREFLQVLKKKVENGKNRTIAKSEFKIFFHERNQGKGACLKAGLKHATGDIVLIQDADLEYNPKDYPKLLKPILDGRADVVYGSRLITIGAHRVSFFWHYVGNKLLTLLCNMLTNLNLTDMETGYKVFRSEVLKGIKIKSNRFGFEPEITIKIA